MRWTAYDPKGTKGLYVTLAPADATLRIDCGINGERRPDMVFGGTGAANPPELPVTLDFRDLAISPVITEPFQPKADGYHIMRHRGPGARSRKGAALQPPDERTLEQLRSLGYLR